MSVYEAPPDGVFWSIIACLFMIAVILIGIIWSRIGPKGK